MKIPGYDSEIYYACAIDALETISQIISYYLYHGENANLDVHTSSVIVTIRRVSVCVCMRVYVYALACLCVYVRACIYTMRPYVVRACICVCVRARACRGDRGNKPWVITPIPRMSTDHFFFNPFGMSRAYLLK